MLVRKSAECEDGDGKRKSWGGMETSDVPFSTLNGLFSDQIAPHHLRFLRSLV